MTTNTIKMNEVRVGDCFRFVEEPDCKPHYGDTIEHRAAPDDLPDAWNSLDIDDKDKALRWWGNNGEKLVELLEHYNRSPQPVVLTRGHILVGECFEYLDWPSEKVLMVEEQGKWSKHTLPTGWKIAPISSIQHKPVRRIPHWNHVGEWRGLPPGDVMAEPVVGTPLTYLLAEKSGDLDGAECLRRLELAMQTESLARPRHDLPAMVSTYAEGLDAEQVALGLKVWTATLADKRAQAAALAKAREVVIVVDSDIELEPWLPSTSEAE